MSERLSRGAGVVNVSMVRMCDSVVMPDAISVFFVVNVSMVTNVTVSVSAVTY